MHVWCLVTTNVPIKNLRKLKVFNECPELLVKETALVGGDTTSLTEFSKWLDNEEEFQFSGQHVTAFGDVCEELLRTAIVQCGSETLEIPIRKLRNFGLFIKHPDLLLRPYVVKCTGNVDVFNVLLRVRSGGHDEIPCVDQANANCFLDLFDELCITIDIMCGCTHFELPVKDLRGLKLFLDESILFSNVL